MNKNITKIAVIVFSVIIYAEYDIYSQNINTYERKYVSKWNRVLDLGKNIKQGSVKERLETKEHILDILLKEEQHYPVVYVDQNATGTGDGSSWQNAYNEIQPAIEYLSDQEGEGWIWVARGIYNPVYISSGIMVFGGFSGDEGTLDERNYIENETVIRDRNGPGPKGPSGVTMSHTSLIDGFTIRNCGYFNYDGEGKLADNFVGGGIRTWSWFSIIRNNHIYDNKACSGSGIAAWGRHDYQRVKDYAPIIERNVIHHNSATCGAVVIHTSEVLFANNVVCFNRCDIIPDKSKGIEIDIDPTVCDKPIVINSIIWRNTKKKYFPDLYNHINKVDKFGDAAKAVSLYNCIDHKGYGEGLVNDNPLFIDPDNYNYQLKESSPCIDAGHPESPLDADSTRADIGIFMLQYYLTIIDSSKTDPLWKQQYFPGSMVSISADSVVLDSAGTTQYLFNHWTGYGNGSYTGAVRDTSVSMVSNITQIIDWYKQFRLDVNTGTDIDSCSGWYGENSSVNFSLPSVIHLGGGTRKRFLEWQCISKVTITSQDTFVTLIIKNPMTLSASWEKEYFLDLNSEYGTPEGEGWYKEGDTVRFAIDSSVCAEEGIRYIFTQWQGSGEGSYTGVSPDSSVVMWNPVTQTACWKTQYFLSVESDYGNPQGQGWYDAPRSVQISVDTVDSIHPETRMHFCGWEGNGYTGLNSSPTIVMSEPVIQKATWQREYWIDITVEPEEGGEVIPYGIPGAWLEGNDSVTFSVIENIEDGYGFYSWLGDTVSTDKCLQLRITEPTDLTAMFKKGSVIIATVPSGLNITADGQDLTEPAVFFWKKGEQHEVDVPTPQEYGDTSRFTFERWKTGGTKRHTVVVTEKLQRLTAYFNPEYYVTLATDYAQESVRGTGWYESGTTAEISIDSISADSAGIRQRFSEWTGTISSTASQFEIDVIKPFFLRAEWIEQYFLEVMIIPPDSGQVDLTPPDNWYDSGTEITLEAFPFSDNTEFVKWSGSIVSADNPINYRIETPCTIYAHFNSQFNTEPEITDIPDISLKEDSILQIMVNDYIADSTDPVTDLCFSIKNNTHFSLDYNNTAGVLNVIPQPDWFGVDTVILEVRDKWQLSDQDTFVVQVQPVDDPPGEFSLIRPENETVIRDTTDFLEFSWQPATEVDGETVLYDLFLSIDSLFDSGFIIEERNITETHVTLDISDVHTTVYWRVAARDENNTTSCLNPFRLTAVFEDWDISFDDVALYQNFPNPFNSETQITFYLPRSSKVKIKIFDSCGRLVSGVADDRFSRGVHSLFWNIYDIENYEISSGIYFLQAHLGKTVLHSKMMVVK